MAQPIWTWLRDCRVFNLGPSWTSPLSRCPWSHWQPLGLLHCILTFLLAYICLWVCKMSSHLSLHALNNVFLNFPLSNASVTMTVFRMEMPNRQNMTIDYIKAAEQHWVRACHVGEEEEGGSRQMRNTRGSISPSVQSEMIIINQM